MNVSPFQPRPIGEREVAIPEEFASLLLVAEDQMSTDGVSLVDFADEVFHKRSVVSLPNSKSVPPLA
jgi:hypothetical protein